jgi:hypothetical protein
MRTLVEEIERIRKWWRGHPRAAQDMADAVNDEACLRSGHPPCRLMLCESHPPLYIKSVKDGVITVDVQGEDEK